MLKERPKVIYGTITHVSNNHYIDLLTSNKDTYINIYSTSINNQDIFMIRARQEILDQLINSEKFESKVNSELVYMMVDIFDLLQIEDPLFQDAILFTSEIFNNHAFKNS